MSEPENPINLTSTSTHRHVLVAFKYGEDAFNASNFSPNAVSPGNSLTNVDGDNFVVVNEFRDNQRFSIPEAIWDFDFIPEIGVSTSSSVGKIVIHDSYVPYSFLDFLKENLRTKFGSDTSLSQVTFMLKTFFSLTQDDNDAVLDNINVNPYFFTLDSIESIPSTLRVVPDKHILHVMGVHNTTGLLRSFSSIFQMNITHKDGNLHDEVPQANGTLVDLQTRASENTSNNTKRKIRLDKSKPMVNLKDVFDSFETDLNQQKYVHKAQLQQWIRNIRSEPNLDKIVVAPKQEKIGATEELPIDFKIDLDGVYNEYPVDNRNMPFEQPEVNQLSAGIRVFPIRTGLDIFTLVERLMLLSKRVGEDASATDKKTFKTTVTAIKKKTNRYEINIKIRQYSLPINSSTEDTGPGDAKAPLTFFVNDVKDRDRDVLTFKSHINYRVGDKMLEKQNEDIVGAGVVYGDREQATAERRPDIPFFGSMYSGIRPMIMSYTIDGLESAEHAGDIYNLLDRYTYTQTSDYELVILGNPLLMSDLNRNPIDVVNDVAGNVVNYYMTPETSPIYIKLTIFERSFADGEDEDISPTFYYDNYYHVTKVVNAFGQGNSPRSFYQKLYLRRTDDLI